VIPKWKQSEINAANKYNGRLVPGSGCFSNSKLDIRIDEGPLTGYRMENKHTTKTSFSLKQEILRKASVQAMLTGNKAIVRIDYDGDEYILMSEKVFSTLLERIPEE